MAYVTWTIETADVMDWAIADERLIYWLAEQV